MRASFRKVFRSYAFLWIIGHFLSNRTCVPCSLVKKKTPWILFVIVTALLASSNLWKRTGYIHIIFTLLINWKATDLMVCKKTFNYISVFGFCLFRCFPILASCNFKVISLSIECNETKVARNCLSSVNFETSQKTLVLNQNILIGNNFYNYFVFNTISTQVH